MEKGVSVAFYLADALYRLGFPWNKVGAEGLKIVDRFSSSGVDAGTDFDMLVQMRGYFEEVRRAPPDAPPMTFETPFAPSEYTVVDDLISSLEDLAGTLPWVAEPIYDILSDYDEYLKSIRASQKLKERSGRLRHSISDLEDRASGRA